MRRQFVLIAPAMTQRTRSGLVLATLASLLWSGCQSEHEWLYVSAEQSGEIAVIDPVRATLVARIAAGKRPRGLRLSQDGELLYVAQSGSPRGGPNVDESKLPPADRAADGIGVVDLRTRKLLRALPGGQDPEAFDRSLDGKTLYVSNEETAELSVVDVAAATIRKRVPIGGQPEGVTLRPDGKFVYVTSEEDDCVVAVDTTSLAAVARMPTGKRPRAIVFTADGRSAFVTNELGASISVIDAARHVTTQHIAIAEAGAPEQRPMGAVLSPDGKQLFVSTGRGGAVAVVDVAQRKLLRLIRDVGTRPWGIGVSHDGKRLYTANGPSNDVSIIDLASGKVRRVKVGGLPWGLIVATGKP
jgi:YVTN family beta-propeller protein